MVQMAEVTENTEPKYLKRQEISDINELDDLTDMAENLSDWLTLSEVGGEEGAELKLKGEIVIMLKLLNG